MNFQPVPEKQIHRIIPDGCIDIVINLFSPSSRKAAHVTGLTTRSEVLQFSEARSLFGIRIYSEAARAILKSPLSMFKGQRVFLEDTWGLEGLYWVEQILTAETISDILAIADRQLNKILTESIPVIPPLVSQSMQIIYHNKGNLSVTDLAGQAHCSERHLRRAFKQELVS